MTDNVPSSIMNPMNANAPYNDMFARKTKQNKSEPVTPRLIKSS